MFVPLCCLQIWVKGLLIVPQGLMCLAWALTGRPFQRLVEFFFFNPQGKEALAETSIINSEVFRCARGSFRPHTLHSC